MQIGLVIMQFLHLLFAGILIGSVAYMTFVLWPVLLKRPAAESKAFFGIFYKRTKFFMALSGGLTFLTGLLRGTVFGQIRSVEALQTPYGITFLIGLVLTVFMLIHGPRTAPQLEKAVWDENEYKPQAAAKAKGILQFSAIMTLLILVCMILMHFGL